MNNNNCRQVERVKRNKSDTLQLLQFHFVLRRFSSLSSLVVLDDFSFIFRILHTFFSATFSIFEVDWMRLAKQFDELREKWSPFLVLRSIYFCVAIVRFPGSPFIAFSEFVPLGFGGKSQQVTIKNNVSIYDFIIRRFRKRCRCHCCLISFRTRESAAWPIHATRT